MYTGPQPMEVAKMDETGVDGRRKLLENLKPRTNYVVEIQAQTRKGWGIRLRRTEKTVAWAAPAKPEKPTVEGSAVDEVRVYYNFGLGGGYTHDFLVMYRKKMEGEEFQSTNG
ncbi:fibronectin type III domain-containing protein-like [Acropora millepora]|uniref:fibronectin type III domain-containing protein-like n=1 Tax=Acropora millepora TaxID=45264 RepID=UPI001CF429E7|nr:fibronectin type III domain-containing protein-like [Acropora millepora]